jgi:D-glycero-alpha-D-manno-heptose-7-phosphate kinase
VSVHESYLNEMLLRYSQIERVKSISEIQHPIIREAMRLLNFDVPNIEITSFADIAAGTGLGSSGSFTTALLKGMKKFQGEFITPEQTASLACHLEIDVLHEPVGKQDQYIAAYGGVTCFEFKSDDSVSVSPLKVPAGFLNELNDHILMYSLQKTRSASGVLIDQKTRTSGGDQSMIENLKQVREMGWESKPLLEAGRLAEFGRLMDRHWQTKKQRSKGMSNPEIDQYYELAMQNGAFGGKVVGAGGGGFLMLCVEEPARVRRAFRETGLKELRYEWDFEGTRII